VKQHAADLLPGAQRAADIDRQRQAPSSNGAPSSTAASSKMRAVSRLRLT